MSASSVADGLLFAHGFSLRKRPLVRAFTGRTDVRFVRRGHSIPPGARLLLWGATPAPGGLAAGVHIVRMEDGFLRSVGLGADLVRPLSWVLDDRGIYFDARRPSALEHLLQHTQFAAAELQRAAVLRARIVHAGLTKYNLPAAPWQPRTTAELVLVTGQVESDASIAAGTMDTRTNIDLLRAVRQARPDAHIVYKPHPDVVAGLRPAGRGEDEAPRFCDEVVREAPLPQLLAQASEVHVMTSLAGFEALLRGKRVCCWGQPFYAGWGLTVDRHPHLRRTRRLTLDELVAGALLRYPLYLSRSSGKPCSPEQAVDELLEWRARQPAVGWWRRWMRPLIARP